MYACKHAHTHVGASHLGLILGNLLTKFQIMDTIHNITMNISYYGILKIKILI